MLQTPRAGILLTAIAVLMSTLAPSRAQSEPSAPAAYDLVLRGGTLVDGKSRQLLRADLAIADGRIAAIGEVEAAPGTPVLHVTGLHVAPGFVDVHGHADASVARSPHCRNFLLMGVTTLITGNCGSSMSDLAKHYRRIEKGGIGLNYGSLVGHATARRAAMGSADRAPTDAELDEMRTLVRRGMAAGAFGLSTGLIYVPGTYAKTAEIAELAKVAAEFGGLYVSHMRNENSRMPKAIAEALAIGEAANCPVHISHIKCSGKKNHGRSTEMLDLLRAAKNRGVAVSADQYAYDASSTGLDVLFPTDELAVGRKEFAGRLTNDPEFRTKIQRAMLATMDRVGFGDFRYARISSARKNAKYNGMLIPDAAKAEFGGDSREQQIEMAMKLFIDAAPSRVQMVYHTMANEDVDNYMQQDWIAIASDAGIRSQNSTSRPHPRGAGNNPRVLARYVRELGILDLPTAVHKMSSLPASLFGITDRGVLRVGAFADLVVFDAEKVQDTATFKEPTNVPEGITHVFVNGRLAAHHGRLTGERAGVVLRFRGSQAEGQGR
ncbi:MAG: D-aminoacylase [bacterium]|nr:D-aminoacylase [bacterium]